MNPRSDLAVLHPLADACPSCHPGDHPAVAPIADPVDDGGSLRAAYQHEVCGTSWECAWDAASVWPSHDGGDTPRTLGARSIRRQAHVSCVMLGRMTETSDLLDLAGLIRSGDARKIRESAGITTETIAADLEVSAATVARWETGAITPSRQHAVAWLGLLRQIGDASRIAGQQGAL